MISVEQDDPPIGMGRLTPPLARGGGVRRYMRDHRAFVSSLAFFIVMIAAFAVLNPSIWSKSTVYTAVAISLPTLSIISVALVFVVSAGEIDLSFGAAVTFAGLIFSYAALDGLNPFLAALLAVLAGIGIGLVNGFLVAYIGLSSLIATLGMSYFWAGLANIVSNGTGTPLKLAPKFMAADDFSWGRSAASPSRCCGVSDLRFSRLSCSIGTSSAPMRAMWATTSALLGRWASISSSRGC